MSIFKRKKQPTNYVLNEHLVDATLPTFGMRLETYHPSGFAINKIENLEGIYKGASNRLGGLIATADIHSTGGECDALVDGEMEHMELLHEAQEAQNQQQIDHIITLRQMRLHSLDRQISPLQKRADKLKAQIDPLEGISSGFQLRIGSLILSSGLLFTLAMMLVDVAVYFSFLENIVTQNAILLATTVLVLVLMSDLSMYLLGSLVNVGRDAFKSKTLYTPTFILLAGIFVFSVVCSFAIRFGTMDLFYGSYNGDGMLVPHPGPFNRGQYALTVITGAAPAVTGVASLVVTLFDKNGHLVSTRERLKKDLAASETQLDTLLNEKFILENAPDHSTRYAVENKVASKQLEVLRKGVKLQVRKEMAERINDPDFTERMAESGKEILAGTASNTDRSTFSLHKAS